MRELVRAPGHDRARSLGWLAVNWIEQTCVHGPGDVQGQPVTLDEELTEFVVDAYALDEDGRRLYDSAFLSRAKGRAKSELAAFIVLFEALGPCRFSGTWATGGEVFEDRHCHHEYMAGEPMGQRVVAPFIRCMATEEGQAGNTYDHVYFNLTEGPLAQGLPSDAAGLTRTFLPGGGEIRPSTSGNASKDGGRESFCVYDETHLYVLPELRRMYATVRRNSAKRAAAQPWTLETSTMYQAGEESVAEATHAYARMIMDGSVRSARLLFDHREADGDVDLTDADAITTALCEVYGPFAQHMDLPRIINEIWDPRNSPSDSRRYFFNQRSGANDAWIEEHEWRRVARPDRVVARGETIVLGFDGSRRRSRGVTDATALIGCTVEDGHLFEVGVWEQPPGPQGDGWRVPTGEVDATVAHAFEEFEVVGFFADPAKWETFVAKWEADYGRHLLAKATHQHPIEWWITGGRVGLVVRALGEFHDAILDEELSHSGEWALHRHIVNARRRPTRSGLTIGKEHPDSPKKIDAAIAAMLAWQARNDAIAAGALTPTARRSTGSFVPRRIR